MPYSLSIWLDEITAKQLELLCDSEERKRGDMVRYLIRQAVRKRNHHVANPEEINKIHEGAQIVKD